MIGPAAAGHVHPTLLSTQQHLTKQQKAARTERPFTCPVYSRRPPTGRRGRTARHGRLPKGSQNRHPPPAAAPPTPVGTPGPAPVPRGARLNEKYADIINCSIFEMLNGLNGPQQTTSQYTDQCGGGVRVYQTADCAIITKPTGEQAERVSTTPADDVEGDVTHRGRTGTSPCRLHTSRRRLRSQRSGRDRLPPQAAPA